MYVHLFNEFLISDSTLQVYEGDKLVFESAKDRVLPLLEYIDSSPPDRQHLVIFDKIMGNAAALLSVKVGCGEVYSPLGSQIAVNTLNKYGVKHHLSKIVPYIQKGDGEDMCPLEKLSLGKEPEEFYKAVLSFISARNR